MTFDFKLLDELAMTFVEASVRQLEMQFLDGAIAPGTTMYRRCEPCPGKRFERRPCHTKFRVADHDQGPGHEHVAIMGVVCPFQRTT